MNAVGKAVTAFYSARAALARALFNGEVPANEDAERLRRDGVVVFDRLMPAASLESIAALNAGRFDYENAAGTVFSPDGKAIAAGDSVTRERFAEYYFLHIARYGEKLDLYRVVDPLVRPVLRAYFRSHYYYRELDCYRSQPVASAYSGSYAWHRDNYPPACLKVMVYLTDVLDPADGPLVYALGSHRGFRPELGLYGPRVPREEVEGKLELKTCLGGRGTIILFDNNGVHRASNPARGHREVINSLILPSVTDSRPPVAGTAVEDEGGFLKRYTR